MPAADRPDIDPDIRPDLGVIQGGGEGDGVPRGDLQEAEQDGGLYNAGGEGGGTSSKAVSPDNLKTGEESGQGGKDDSGSAGEDDEDNQPRGRFGRARQRLQSLRSGAFKNKWLAVFGFGGAAILAIILILMILLGSFKIIQLAEHISAYQFARVTRNYSLNVNQITAEDTALSTADRNALQRAYDQFGNVKDKTWGSMYEKINNYRPNKIVENMVSDGTLDFKYERGGITSLWQKKMTAIIIDGKEIPVNDTSLFRRYIHPLQARQDRIAFSDEANQALAESMQGRSSIVRGAVAAAIRGKYDISLQWWKQLTKYKGANDKKAAALTEAEAEAEIDKGITPAASAVDKVSSAAGEAEAEVKACVADTACNNQLVDSNGQLPSKVLETLKNVTTNDLFQQAVGFINKSYAVALPVCLIYDGSLQSGPGQNQVINNSTAQDERAYYMVTTAADQQKYGNTVGEAVGGMNWKTGNTSKSIPELRSGGVNVNTSGETSPQSATNGDLGNTTSIFSFLPSPASDLADYLAGGACPYLTNIWLGAGIGIGNLVVGFFSGGTSTVAADGLAAALRSYMGDFIARAVTKKEAAKLGVFVAGTEGLTLLAKMLVAQKAGVANSGLPVGVPVDNMADKGGNLNAQETSRGFYGRPLNNAEVKGTAYQDQVFAAAMTSRKSTFQRYFAISNPDSLLTKLGTGLSAHISMSFFSGLLNIGAKLLNPLKSLASLFGSLNPQFALASGSTDDQNYGIVQWGWSNDEENLIKNNPDYFPLENQKILEDSNMSDAIQQKYGVCFDLNTQMGDMLTGDHPLITRAANGDVADSGLCSPANLTYTNNEFGQAMVFRWRLEKSYEVTLDQLENMQTVDSSGSAAGTASGFTNPFPDGWTPGRLDMGYDGAFTNQIVSPCTGKMVYVNANTSHSDLGGWKGAFIAVQCSQPIPGFKSNVFFFAEGLTPTVTQDLTVTAGQRIAVPGWTGYSEGPGGIEWGLANPDNPATVTLAASGIDGMTNCSAASKTMVLAFSEWVQQNLGVKPPAETGDAGCA